MFYLLYLVLPGAWILPEAADPIVATVKRQNISMLKSSVDYTKTVFKIILVQILIKLNYMYTHYTFKEAASNFQNFGFGDWYKK